MYPCLMRLVNSLTLVRVKTSKCTYMYEKLTDRKSPASHYFEFVSFFHVNCHSQKLVWLNHGTP